MVELRTNPMKVTCYPFLCDAARKIRETVFMTEQNFQKEFDEVDKDSLHLVMYTAQGEAVATCRIFKDTTQQTYVLGRLAVSKTYRGRGLGSRLLAEAESLVRKKGGNVISLHSQCRAQAFYAKVGYIAYGEIDDDEGCPHIWMRKSLL